ncbi:MAG: hypothetical protein WBA17_12085 [Saprospiraceae bacterium]
MTVSFPYHSGRCRSVCGPLLLLLVSVALAAPVRGQSAADGTAAPAPEVRKERSFQHEVSAAQLFGRKVDHFSGGFGNFRGFEQERHRPLGITAEYHLTWRRGRFDFGPGLIVGTMDIANPGRDLAALVLRGRYRGKTLFLQLDAGPAGSPGIGLSGVSREGIHPLIHPSVGVFLQRDQNFFLDLGYRFVRVDYRWDHPWREGFTTRKINYQRLTLRLGRRF